MIELEAIRKNVQEALKESGMKQKELANKLHITQSMISKYINGNKLPALDTFANICIILDLDSNEVLNIK